MVSGRIFAPGGWRWRQGRWLKSSFHFQFSRFELWNRNTICRAIVQSRPSLRSKKNGSGHNFPIFLWPRYDIFLAWLDCRVRSTYLKIWFLINWITTILIVPCCWSTFWWEFDWVSTRNFTVFHTVFDFSLAFHLGAENFFTRRFSSTNQTLLSRLHCPLVNFTTATRFYQTKLTNRTENGEIFLFNLPASIVWKFSLANTKLGNQHESW